VRPTPAYNISPANSARQPAQGQIAPGTGRANVDLDASLRKLRDLGTRADQAKTANDKELIFAQCGNCHAALGIRMPSGPSAAAVARKRVEITADEIVITEKIQFGFDTAIIKPESYGLLNEIAEAINDNPQPRKITIEGHTDSTGDAA
jgi:outer membrane protein OmpA-like peptidoglycan-associated protein